MDLIYREQALELINDKNIEAHMDSVMDGELHRVKRAVQRIVVSMPSAEKTGKWIDKPGPYYRMQSWCSCCGQHSGIGGIESNRHKPYCPNCGARMEVMPK